MRLDPAQRASLDRGELLAVDVARIVNENPRLKAAGMWFNHTVSSRWMSLSSGRRMKLVGMDKMAALRPDRGVLLAANHRSFFDMFMVATQLHHHTSLCQRLYFPVRSTFFYERPLGMLVNALTCSMAMYPPIFRAAEKRAVTRAGLDFLAAELARPGTVVGIHPEGTRGKGPDPYELLPAEQGFGRVVLQAHPIVIPIFINGMTNDLILEWRRTFRRADIPIIMVFGDPIDFGDLANADPTRLRAQIDVGRRALREIARLGEIERTFRRTGHEPAVVR